MTAVAASGTKSISGQQLRGVGGLAHFEPRGSTHAAGTKSSCVRQVQQNGLACGLVLVSADLAGGTPSQVRRLCRGLQEFPLAVLLEQVHVQVA